MDMYTYNYMNGYVYIYVIGCIHNYIYVYMDVYLQYQHLPVYQYKDINTGE